MNSFFQKILTDVSRQSTQFSSYLSQEYPILRSQVLNAKYCIEYIINRTDASDSLLLALNGFSQYKGWSDQKKKIDNQYFFDITNAYIADKNLFNSWSEFFGNELELIQERARNSKGFLSGYNSGFVVFLKEELNRIFAYVQKLTDCILCLGIHKFMLSGKTRSPRDTIYLIGERTLGQKISGEFRVLDQSIKFDMNLVALLTGLASDLI